MAKYNNNYKTKLYPIPKGFLPHRTGLKIIKGKVYLEVELIDQSFQLSLQSLIQK